MATETFEYESEFTRSLEARGEVRGRAAAVLRILTVRGVLIPDAIRDRVNACTDLEQLELWGDRAVTVQDAEDLFS